MAQIRWEPTNALKADSCSYCESQHQAIPETFGLVQQLQPSNGTIPRKVAVMHTIPGWRHFGIEFRIHRVGTSRCKFGIHRCCFFTVVGLAGFLWPFRGEQLAYNYQCQNLSFQPCNFGAGETFPSKKSSGHLQTLRPTPFQAQKLPSWRSCSFQLLVSGQGLTPTKRTNIPVKNQGLEDVISFGDGPFFGGHAMACGHFRGM